MRRVLKLFAFAVLILLLVAISIAAFLLYREVETSAYQARRLTELLQDVRWEMKPGQSQGCVYPRPGRMISGWGTAACRNCSRV